MKKIFYLLIFCISFGSQAQEFNREKMDSLFTILEANDKVMGSVSLFQDGKEIYKRSLGFADVEKKQKANAETKYRVGSISKTFTAAIIMQLMEEGKLTLDTKLSSFFPQLPNASEITVKHLLKHQSGLFNFTESSSYTHWMESPKSRNELLEIIKENGTVFKPGNKSEYSNTNYVLLSFIAEDIEKDKFPKILNKRIIEPLKLKNTSFGGIINTAKNEAQSYLKMDTWKTATETDMSIPLGAGSIISTPTDLNKFYTALFNGKIVNEASLNQMKKIENGYGIGLFQLPFGDKTAYAHTGRIDNFTSSAGYFPSEDFQFALTLNGAGIDQNFIAIGILSIYFDLPYELPVYTTYKVAAEDLEPLIGVYSAEGFPLKVTISREGNTLIAQATGQSSFPLDAYAKNKFRFDQANLTLEFLPEEGKMILIQGAKIVMQKE